MRLRLGENKQRIDGMVNVPLSDTVALRVNGVWNQSDGWVQDAATGKDLWPEENWAMRAALKWDITDETSATLTWDHDQIDQLARPAIGLVALGPNDTTVPFPPDPATYIDPLKAPVYNDVIGNEESRKLDAATLFIDHAFSWSDFRSTTAWRTFETVNREDEDGTNRIALYFDTANVEDNTSFYQEFKLSGQSDAIDWVAGVSYYSEDAEQASDTHAAGQHRHRCATSGSPARPTARCSAPATCSLPTDSAMRGLPWREVMNNEARSRATALFGDVIWHATDRMNVTFGLRYTHDEKEFSWLNGPRRRRNLTPRRRPGGRRILCRSRWPIRRSLQLRRRVCPSRPSTGRRSRAKVKLRTRGTISARAW
jgi:iron complex outermembrane receptor protein